MPVPVLAEGTYRAGHLHTYVSTVQWGVAALPRFPLAGDWPFLVLPAPHRKGQRIPAQPPPVPSLVGVPILLLGKGRQKMLGNDSRQPPLLRMAGGAASSSRTPRTGRWREGWDSGTGLLALSLRQQPWVQAWSPCWVLQVSTSNQCYSQEQVPPRAAQHYTAPRILCLGLTVPCQPPSQPCLSRCGGGTQEGAPHRRATASKRAGAQCRVQGLWQMGLGRASGDQGHICLPVNRARPSCESSTNSLPRVTGLPPQLATSLLSARTHSPSPGAAAAGPRPPCSAFVSSWVWPLEDNVFPSPVLAEPRA